jgi:hypothetical protein
METTFKTPHAPIIRSEKETVVRQSSVFWDKMESERYAWVPFIVTLIGCMGGIAAAFGANYDALRLSLVAVPTAITLALNLAVAPMRWIIWAFAITLFLDIVLLII